MERNGGVGVEGVNETVALGFSASLFPPAEIEPFIGGGLCHCFGVWPTIGLCFDIGM